ncbi:MAG TPA: response regulator [Candidatus Omnitrophica bacterium]|nr:MAG: hypothetical protein A2Z81_03480 [Omnitrophica WOR_2 bacterium GWA2_45_18]HBR14353.1 response regulator [Candidatus Omnitrophota bacterium]
MEKKRILIVDDEKSFTSILRINLESVGNYDVTVENDSNKAFSTALHLKPDLILLDVMMPQKEGPDVAMEIRNNKVLQETPIVFLTATVTTEEVKSQGGWIGGHPFIAKPSRLDVLLNSIEANFKADE